MTGPEGNKLTVSQGTSLKVIYYIIQLEILKLEIQ